jgi:hypothetical protein
MPTSPSTCAERLTREVSLDERVFGPRWALAAGTDAVGTLGRFVHTSRPGSAQTRRTFCLRSMAFE